MKEILAHTHTHTSERTLSVNLQCVDRLSTEQGKQPKNHN